MCELKSTFKKCNPKKISKAETKNISEQSEINLYMLHARNLESIDVCNICSF